MELMDDARTASRNGSLPGSSRTDTGGFRLFGPGRQFDPAEPELIDRAGTSAEWLREELQLMAHANARYGVHELLLGYVERLTKPIENKPLTILDLATGSADIPRAIAERFRQLGRAVSITAVDRNPEVLRLATELSREWPEICVEAQDVLSLTFEPDSFDLVMCSQALHHFSSTDAVKILGCAWEICRAGCIINDLRRNWASIGLTKIAVQAFTASPIVRHDAPQSCRAAFTVEELRALAARAGMKNVNIRRHHGPFRMVLTAEK